MKKTSHLPYEQYCQLDSSAQLLLLWRSGHRLTSVVRGDLRFTLYRLDDFYVEICCRSPEREVLELRPFSDT